jgi:hypothetical protein
MLLAASIALLLSAPPAKARSDAGADQSDSEFTEAFGKQGNDDKGAKATAWVPPAPGSAGAGTLEKLTPKHIKDVVAQAKGDIDRCADGQTDLKRGKSVLTLKWTIALDGRVTKVEVVGDQLKGSYVAGCVSRLVKQWQFPKHTVPSEPVTVPFKL